MKLLHIFTILFCFIAHIGNASILDDTIAKDNNQKVFIKPSQVVFSEQGEIFVLVNNEMVQVNCLKTNHQGIYFERKTGYWVCPRCGNRNELGCWDCARCDYTLPK